ncbi:MAG: MFS transporter, partial [Dehalococcoidia bacterium]|nr:MFS transporter [Dehalococcoidia bacterium]
MTTAEPPARPTPDHSDDADAYNVAARIYGNGSPPPASPPRQRASSGTANGARPTNDAGENGPIDGSDARFNLAERIYGGGANGGRHSATANGVASGQPEQYNLAGRVYGDGAALDGDVVAAPPPESSPPSAQPAVAAVAPPRFGGPPAPAATALALAGGPPKRRFSIRTFDSLSVPAFRWYLLAQLGSFGAMNMQMLVRSVIVFQLTGSYAALGTTSLFTAIPGLGLTMFGGLVADRFPKKRVVQVGQTGSAVMALIIGTLLFTDRLQFWHLLASSVVQGTIMALMMPSRQAMMPEVVGMDRLMNATALGMGTMNLMRLVGPAGGGFLLATMGGEWVYFVIVGFYLWSVLMLAKVPLVSAAMSVAGAAGAGMRSSMGGPAGSRPAGTGMRPGGIGGPGGMGGMGGPGRRRGGGELGEIWNGLRYIRHNPTIMTLLLTSLAMVIFSMPYQMMLPGYVLDVLGGGPEMVGLLMSITSVGSLGATLVIASMPG